MYLCNKMQSTTKYLIIILLIAGLSSLASSGVNGSNPFDEKTVLTKLDASMDNYVSVCSNPENVPLQSDRKICNDDLEDLWYEQCGRHYEKLDICKNGKLENYLKEHGLL